MCYCRRRWKSWSLGGRYAQLEEDDNPVTRRRLAAATEKLAEVQKTLLPLSQMPDWLQQLAKFLPSYYFTNALIDVTVQGRTLAETWGNLLALVAWGVWGT